MPDRLTLAPIRWSVAARLALRLAIAVGLTLLSTALDHWLKVDTGLTRSVTVGPGFSGPELLPAAVAREIDLAFIDDAPNGPRRYFSVKWEGHWWVDRDGAVDLYVGGDDRVSFPVK